MLVRRALCVMLVLISLYSVVFAEENGPAEEPTNTKLSRSAGNGASPGSLLGSSDTLLFTGSFTYSIPLPVPPGTHGLQPNLVLGYNSSSSNGWCGVGWDLSFGIIQRSTKNGIPTYSNNPDGSFKDTLVFSSGGGSQELVKIALNEYRVKIDSAFMKFVFNPTDNEWTAYDKGGTRYIFGHGWGGDAKVVKPTATNNPPQPNDVFSWSLSSIIDTNDNEIYFFYTHNQNQIYPSAIQYTHHLNETLPMRWVLFNFEDRTDIITSYRSGFPITTAKRLKTIETKVEDTLVKKYELNYTSHPDTTHSLLTEVKVYSKDETPFPISTAFAYQMNENPGLENGAEWTTVGTDRGFYFFDFNSDGKTDLANNISGNAGLNVWHSTGNGLASAGTNPWLDSSVSGDFYFADFNGDGYLDVGVAKIVTITLPPPQNSQVLGLTYRVWISNQGEGLIATGEWITMPGQSEPIRFLLGDFNGDGKTDLAREVSTGLEIYYKSDNENKFAAPVTWPVSTGVGGYFVVDLNGDGKSDIARRVSEDSTYKYGLHVWFTNSESTGFEDKGEWISGSLQTGKIYFADFNGDGLTDVAHHPTIHKELYIWHSNGSGLPAFGGEYSFISQDRLFFYDFNGDGLVDVGRNSSYGENGYGGLYVWLNTGQNFISKGEWTSAGTTKRNFQFYDFNGDGKTDVAGYTSQDNNTGGVGGLVVFPNKGNIPNLLNSIQNTLGGKTEISYVSSTNNVSNTFLPFPIQVISTLTSSDGMEIFALPGSHSYTTTYTYKNGLYDLKSKEFLGFGEVRTTDGAGNYVITKFKQNEDQNMEIEGSTKTYVNYFKGKIFEQTNYDSTETPLSKTVSTYDCTDAATGGVLSSSTRWYFPHVIRNDNYTYDGGVEKHTAADVSYGNYGNVTVAKSWGEIVNNQYTNSGDEVITTTQYAANTDKYIVGLLKTQETSDSSGTTVAKVEFFYDNKPAEEVDKGNLTKKTQWLNTGPTNPSVEMTYDNTYGNLIKVKDAQGNETTTTYDETYHTFPVTITNAKGHVQSATYDAGTGDVLTKTDANGQITKYEYDSFGRLRKVFSPIDTTDAPTLVYNYYDTEFPRKVLSRTKQKGGATGDNSTLNYPRAYQFYDGLGRVTQTKAETVSNWGAWIISDCKEYNSRGLVAKAYDAYFLSTMPPYTTYTYDSLGRIIRQDNPDSSYTTTTFSGWTETKRDGNGHITDYQKDAFGRIIKISEHNQGQIYETNYSYDTLGNLTKIVNAKGEETNITYDSLGRKTAMSDPKMGNWTYTYDANSNLISQTDGKGQTITLAYDALNRLTSKTYPNTTAITYEYDTEGEQYSKGRLIKINDTTGYTKFTYDAVGRVTNTEKKITAKTATKTCVTQSQYNGSGQQTKLTYPNTTQAYSSYDAGGDLLAVHDGIANYAGTMLYDHHKQLLRIDYGNGLSTGYKYNLATSRLVKLISGGESGGSPLPPPPDDPPGTPPPPEDDPGQDPPSPPDGGGGYNPPPPGGGPGGTPPIGGPGGGGGDGGWYWPDPTFIRHNPKDFKAFDEFMKTLKGVEK